MAPRHTAVCLPLTTRAQTGIQKEKEAIGGPAWAASLVQWQEAPGLSDGSSRLYLLPALPVVLGVGEASAGRMGSLGPLSKQDMCRSDHLQVAGFP